VIDGSDEDGGRLLDGASQRSAGLVVKPLDQQIHFILSPNESDEPRVSDQVAGIVMVRTRGSITAHLAIVAMVRDAAARRNGAVLQSHSKTANFRCGGDLVATQAF